MMNNDTKETLYDLIPAYALGALDEPERAAVEAALARDEGLRAELVAYEAVAAELAFAAPARPAPDHLQADLRQRLAATRAASPADVRPPERLPTPPVGRRQRAVYAVRVAWAVAAVLIIVVGLLLALQSGGNLPPDQLYATLEHETAAYRFPLQPGDVTDQVRGELVIAPDGRHAVLAVEALPEIGPDQTFQLWVRGVDGTVRSGGLFRPAEQPVAYIPVSLQANESLDWLLAVGVSLEPAGGSPYADRPTGPRVFAVPLKPEA
ncbi:MAG: hypothetical protein Kow0077_13660 [Anaerolineae bacterium]